MKSKILKNTTKFLLIPLCLLFLCAAIFIIYFVAKTQPVVAQGVTIQIDGNSYRLSAADVGIGSGIKDRLITVEKIFKGQSIYNQTALAAAVRAVAVKSDQPVRDYGINVSGTVISPSLVNNPGKILNQQVAVAKIGAAIDGFQNAVALHTEIQYPTVSAQSAEAAVLLAESIIKNEIVLNYNDASEKIGTATIASWLVADASKQDLILDFDRAKILASINPFVARFDTPVVNLSINVQNNAIQNFTAPQDGLKMNTDQAINDIINILLQRESGAASTAGIAEATNQITLGAEIIKHGAAEIDGQAADMGIVDLIGTATTTFAGSTKNRIVNIKNGAQKLNNLLIAPGQNFSTVDALGDVDAAHGFVQELVIKGPDTVPDYGGGLCQVSTTLFRSALSSGLPITERQNHSYRVSFYEKNGDGKYIGPGLDATIYGPHPDLKFLNDTGHWLLLTSAVEGTKITFNFYGASDGRHSEIIGPKIIALIQPQADPTLQFSGTAAPGTVKEVEFARTGAKATADYIITYPDGTKKEQVFNSYYHPVEAKFVVGQ